MLAVQIICVGKLKEDYWREACAEYSKRLKPFCKFSIIELPEFRLPEKPSQAQIDHALQEEGKKIIAAAKGSALVSLCIEGKEISSPELSHRLFKLGLQGISSVSFLIGSSYGLSDFVKENSSFRMSMSPMTFPHQLARVMLCEQIYRAFQIQSNSRYHK